MQLRTLLKNAAYLSLALIPVLALALFPNTAHAGLWEILATPFEAVNWIIAQAGTLFLWLAGILLFIAGAIFDLAVWASVANFAQYANMPIIRIGWTIIRDLCNMFFIFVILYIAIATILQLSHESIGKLMSKVIIAALLINFSFPITLLVIDASNLISYGFYKKIGGGEFNPFDSDLSIAGRIVGGLQLPGAVQLGSEPRETLKKYGKLTPTAIILNTIGGIVVILIAALIILIAALLFVVRTVAFLFLLILSPFGFFAMVVPGMSSIGEEWRKSLFKYALSAPAFLFMFYIALSLISGGDGSLRAIIDPTGDMSFGQFFSLVLSQVGFAAGGVGGLAAGGLNSNNINILLYFALVIGFFIGTLMVGAKMGAVGAAAAEHAIIGAGKSAGAWVGDHTYGRAARGLRRSDAMTNMAAKQFTGKFTRHLNPLKDWTVKNVMYKPLTKASTGFDTRELKAMEEDKAMIEDIGRDEHGKNKRIRIDQLGKSKEEIAQENLVDTESRGVLQDRIAEIKRNHEERERRLVSEWGRELTDEQKKRLNLQLNQELGPLQEQLDLVKQKLKGTRMRDWLIGKMNPQIMGTFENYSASHLQFIRQKNDGAAAMKEVIEKLQLRQDGAVSRPVTQDVLEDILSHLDKRAVKRVIADPGGRTDKQGRALQVIVVNGTHPDFVKKSEIDLALKSARFAQTEFSEDIDDMHATMRAGHGGGSDH